MLLDIVIHHPQSLPTIVAHTPPWVGVLLLALLALGVSQLRERTLGTARIAAMPVLMTAFTAWGLVSAFGAGAQGAAVLATWLVTGAVATALSASRAAGPARREPAQRRVTVPGSTLPLLLIVGVFLVKWWVGVDLALDPRLAHETGYALTTAAVYGVFSGAFIGRGLRLLLPPQPALARA